MILLIAALVWLGLGALTCLLFAAIVRGGGRASTCYDMEPTAQPQPEPAVVPSIPKPRAAAKPAAKPACASV